MTSESVTHDSTQPPSTHTASTHSQAHSQRLQPHTAWQTHNGSTDSSAAPFTHTENALLPPGGVGLERQGQGGGPITHSQIFHINFLRPSDHKQLPYKIFCYKLLKPRRMEIESPHPVPVKWCCSQAGAVSSRVGNRIRVSAFCT